MPRYTRDQQFVTTFDAFMVSMRDLYFPNLSEWTLEAKTDNKSCSVHPYQFTIPRKIIDYTIDVPFVDENGVQRQNETVKKDQELPCIGEFENYFHGYFNSYILTKSDKIVSYTSLYGTRFTENDEVNGDLITNIVVCYYKSYIPYPSNIQTYKQLSEYCNQLETSNNDFIEELEDKNSEIHYLNIKFEKMKKQYNRNLDSSYKKRSEVVVKMQEKIRGFYSKLPLEELEDCPVCYEKITADLLKVPGCCHYICQDCHSKCESCPICRENY
jgi:hypothetical protein